MVRTASSDGAINLCHPTPDLQSLQGAYVGNIERLEERAERMSSRGSDIGEEIRKLQLEQKLSDSRKSSMHSTAASEARGLPAARSRNASTSSFSNSIVDVNSTARWGGYSPGGFVTSPIGSIRSGSWSQPSLQRHRSISRGSRLGNVVQPEEEDEEKEHGEDISGLPVMHHTVPRLSSPKPPSLRSVSSFTRQYDQIAQAIQNEFEHPPTDETTPEAPFDEQLQDGYFTHPHDLPDRPPTAASTDTYQQARTLFQDFDGVHCSPIEESDPLRSQGSRQSSLLRAMPPPPPPVEPPPSDNMVFYPAPVPRMLNLPKRLSQLPAASVQAKRRTQLLESLPADARKSAIWLPDQIRNSSENLADQKRKSVDPRKSMIGLGNLPPQLRASMYFDQVAPSQEFEVKGESAEATLDSILEASAHAPVGAFTDHPFAGHVGSEVYGKEQARRSTASMLNINKDDARKSRSSLNLLGMRRNSTGDGLNKLQKRNSTNDLNRLTVRNSSRMSVGTGLDENGDHVHPVEGEENDETGETTPRRSIDADQQPHDEDIPEEEEAHDEEPLAPQFHGPPTTLLAELQMRKQQQKNRNRTAATAYPNGMHSTLLELDAVAEVEKKRRHGQRIALAWEDPEVKAAEEEDDDEDVPLGMLFPARDGLINKKGDRAQADWDRPLGLIAQRELEDNEPLSRRRNRLRGIDPRQQESNPSKRMTGMPQNPLPSPEVSPSLPHLPGQAATPPADDDDEEETLAQRKRRLANRQALDGAIGDVSGARPISGEFASEMLSQLGLPKEEDKPGLANAVGDEEEESLGQRRARLRAEALARGEQPTANGDFLAPANATRPPLRASHSMADILAAVPVNSNSARKISNDMLVSALPRGSLLQQSEVKRSRHKEEMMEQNRRSTSYGLDKPLLGDIGKAPPDPALGSKMTAFKGGVYNNGMGGVGGAPPPAAASLAMMNGGMAPGMGLPRQTSAYFPSPTMGTPNVGMQSHMSMNFSPAPFGFPQANIMPPQMQPQMMGLNMGMPMPVPMPMNGFQGFGYPQMSGMPQPGMSPMTMQMMQQPLDPMMDPKQRDMIDRWRQSIMQ